jgi:hypothetical protein
MNLDAPVAGEKPEPREKCTTSTLWNDSVSGLHVLAKYVPESTDHLPWCWTWNLVSIPIPKPLPSVFLHFWLRISFVKFVQERNEVLGKGIGTFPQILIVHCWEGHSNAHLNLL